VGSALFRLSAIILAGLVSFAAQDRASSHETQSHETSNQSPVAAAGFAPIALTIPDTDVVDQNGRKLKFYRDLVKGRAVAINFIFTTCRTICPMLTATFGAVQEDVGDRLGRDLFLISISLDPENDTAFELSAYAQKFGAKPGWTFVTGQPADIAILLKALNASAPVTEDHTAIALIGNGAANTWRRAYGLDSAPVIAAALRQAATGESQVKAGAASYFTNLQLIDQQGRAVRFYDDTLHDRVILITSFFTGCSDICPMAIENLRDAEKILPESLGREIRMIAISVDPEEDTPEKLRDFAKDHGLDDRWTLLTGKKENIDWVLHKLGLYVEDRAQHDTSVLIGNDRTGAWLKLLAMSQPEMIARSIKSVAAGKVAQ
jgi:protein SCO1/2